MNNKKIFILTTLIITLILSSCGNKEVENNEENIEENIENSQVLEELNEEVVNMVDDVETKTNMENTGATDTKVQKLNNVYAVPGGECDVEFSITMSGSVIENVDSNLKKGGEICVKKTTTFQEAVNTELKGKTIEEASKIKVIGGSSLTTEAFKSVLKDLK